jgi:hypothetical protein
MVFSRNALASGPGKAELLFTLQQLIQGEI